MVYATVPRFRRVGHRVSHRRNYNSSVGQKNPVRSLNLSVSAPKCAQLKGRRAETCGWTCSEMCCGAFLWHASIEACSEGAAGAGLHRPACSYTDPWLVRNVLL